MLEFQNFLMQRLTLNVKSGPYPETVFRRKTISQIIDIVHIKVEKANYIGYSPNLPENILAKVFPKVNGTNWVAFTSTEQYKYGSRPSWCVCAGTSDLPVLEESKITLQSLD